MYIIKITNYYDSDDREKPIVTFVMDNTYDSYEKALADISSLVFAHVELYDLSKDHVTFDLIPNELHDARIINEFGDNDFEYDVMEVIKARPNT